VKASAAANQAPSEAVVEPGLLPFLEQGAAQGAPSAIAVTLFHFLALYPNLLRVFSRLSGDVVQVSPSPDPQP
jgi:hypothetical protein